MLTKNFKLLLFGLVFGLILAFSQISSATIQKFSPDDYASKEIRLIESEGLKQLVRALDLLVVPDDTKGQLIRATVPGYQRKYFQFEDSARTDNLQISLRQDFLRKTGKRAEVHAFSVGSFTYLFPTAIQLKNTLELSALLMELGLQQIRNDDLKLVARGKREFLAWARAGYPDFHSFHIFLGEFFKNASIEFMSASVADLHSGALKGLLKRTKLVFPKGSQSADRLPGQNQCLRLEDLYPHHIFMQNNPDMLRAYHFELQKRFPRSHFTKLLADRVEIMEVFVRPANPDKWQKTCIKTWDIIPYEGPSAYKKIRVFPTVTAGSDTRFEVGLVLESAGPGIRSQYGLRPSGYGE